jgi:hypothetical protein
MKSETSEPVPHRIQSHQHSSKGKSQSALVIELVFRSCPQLFCGARARRLQIDKDEAVAVPLIGRVVTPALP